MDDNTNLSHCLMSSAVMFQQSALGNTTGLCNTVTNTNGVSLMSCIMFWVNEVENNGV